MWKKDEPTPTPQPRSEASPRSESRRSGDTHSTERAIIGPSITIKGEVSGDEDLLIQGQVEGSVTLELHSVTVGRDGRVKANITARIVTVEGNVEGDLLAQEQIILRSAARVMGDITAPRVVLEDGASFKGLVDMGEPAGAHASKSKSASASRSDSGNGKTESESSASSASATSGPTGKDTEGAELVNKAAT